MPEKGEAEKATLHGLAKALEGDLDHHHQKPDQPDTDMPSMATYKREESSKKSTALWRCTDCEHVGELAELESEKCGAKRERKECIEVSASNSSRADCQRHQATCV